MSDWIEFLISHTKIPPANKEIEVDYDGGHTQIGFAHDINWDAVKQYRFVGKDTIEKKDGECGYKIFGERQAKMVAEMIEKILRDHSCYLDVISVKGDKIDLVAMIEDDNGKQHHHGQPIKSCGWVK